MTTLPQIRQAPWYSGQLGVWGSDVPRGLRQRSSGIVLYVNNVHPECHDDNDGTDPEAPLVTIQQAVDNLAAWQARYTADGSLSAVGSVVVVAPGTYSEDVTITAGTAPDYCTILGGGNGRYPVIWTPSAGDCLTVTAYGWRFEELHFQPGNGAAGIKLARGAGVAGSEGTVIEGCFFNGGWAGTGFGVELNGAPANVTVQGCRFAEFAADGAAITVTDTSEADPYQTHIFGNTFQECDEYITRDCAGGWNQTVIWHNVFVDGTHDANFPAGAGGTAMFIDMRGGSNGYNKVCDNCLGGTYSEGGGYYDGTGDEWWGNLADVAGGVTQNAPA